MKKGLFSMLILLLAFSFASQSVSATATSSSEYYYLIELQRTTFLPSTIYSGNIVSVAFDIKNRGSIISVEDLNAVLDLGDQFEQFESTNLISLIRPQAVKTLVLKFKVKESTIPGYYPMQLIMNYKRADETVQEIQTIQVPVSKVERTIEVSANPNVIGPGNQTNLTFVLKNIGDSPISNVSFSWSESGSLILPLGSGNKKYIPTIEANSEAEITYRIGTDPNMATGIYPLNVSISFTDTNGLKTQSLPVGVIIGGITDFEISAEQASEQISISIANIGSNNAQSVVVKIPEQQGIRINGANSAILGSINKGDFTIANFQVQQTSFQGVSAFNRDSSGVGSQNPQQPGANAQRDRNSQTMTPQSLTVQIDYTDTTGERQSLQKKITLSNAISTTTASTINSRAQNSQQPVFYWGLLVAAIIIGAVYDKIKGKLSWKKMTAIWLATATAFAIVTIILNSNIIAGAAIAAASVITVVWFSARSKKSVLEAKTGDKRK